MFVVLGPILASLDGKEALDKLGTSVWEAVLNCLCVGLCFFALFVFHDLCSVWKAGLSRDGS